MANSGVVGIRLYRKVIGEVSMRTGEAQFSGAAQMGFRVPFQILRQALLVTVGVDV